MTTLTDDIRERVGSYIRHQAQKEPASLHETVQKGHGDLLAGLAGLSEEQAAYKPGPDDWSVLELLQHVLGGKKGTARLCVALARGEAPPGEAQTGRLPSTQLTLSEARAQLDAAHMEMLSFVDGLTPGANVEARYTHPFFGELNCREWAAFQRVHDGDHANQLGQIRSAQGFPP